MFIHPTSLVETRALGIHARIWAYTHVMAGAQIGHSVNIGEHCFVESGAVIGDNVTIKNGNMIWEGIVLEDGVFVGPRVCFTNDRYPRSQRLPEAATRYQDKAQWLATTVVRSGASVGAGSVILPGLSVGEYALVGAGAIVTRDVPAFALMRGNPAHVSGWVCKCGLPLTIATCNGICTGCGRGYSKVGTSIVPSE